MPKFATDDQKLKYPQTVRHKGTLIVLAADTENNIHYRVLDVEPQRPVDEENWTDARRLSFPREMRVAGMSLVTRELEENETIADDAPFQALSDGKHLYIFRQATTQDLLVDRFIFDDEGNELKPNWEARYQRSRKKDVPANRKDSLGYQDMEGNPFIEPTTRLELTHPRSRDRLIQVQSGQFAALLLPTRIPGQQRWQLFARNRKNMDCFSIRRAPDGLFDLSDVDHSSFRLRSGSEELQFAAGPAATLFTQQETFTDTYGREQNVKRGARVMLAVPVAPDGGDKPIVAVLEFAVSVLGTLTQLPENARLELPVIRFQGDGVPLDSILTDAQGLPLYGGLLGAAQTEHTPLLLDSADGHVHLYFRGLKNEFLVAQYDTQAARARIDLPLLPSDKGRAQLVALRSGAHLNRATLSIEDGAQPGHCRVTIEGGGDDGALETWENVPRRLDRFLAVLNGATSGDPDADGALQYDVNQQRSFSGGQKVHHRFDASAEVGTLRFETRQPADREQKGSVIDVEVTSLGDRRRATCTVKLQLRRDGRRVSETWRQVPAEVTSFVRVLQGQITERKNDPRIREEGRVYYDATQQAASSDPQADLSDGSALFSVHADDVQGLVMTQRVEAEQKGSFLFSTTSDVKESDAALVQVSNTGGREGVALRGRLGRWVPEPQENALRFDGSDDVVELDTHPALDIRGTLGLEAWIKPEPGVSSYARVARYYSSSAQSKYLLGLMPDAGDGKYRPFAGSAGQAAITKKQLAAGQWHHLAAVYKADYALKLTGAEYVDCGAEVADNVEQSLTVEAAVTLAPGMVLSKWGDAPEEQSWMLGVDASQRPYFTVRYQPEGQGEPVEHTLKARRRLPLGRPLHLAGVFDASSQQESALKFDGANTYATPYGSTPLSNDAFTVETWFSTDALKGAPGQVICQLIGSNRSNTFRVRLSNDRLHIDGTDASISFSYPFKSGTWYHIAVVYRREQGRVTLYVNGREEGARPLNLPTKLDQVVPLVGAAQDDPDRLPPSFRSFFQGKMNEFRLWSKARQGHEIRAGMREKMTGTEDGLAACWPLDVLIPQRVGKTTRNVVEGGGDMDVTEGELASVNKGILAQQFYVNGVLHAEKRLGTRDKLVKTQTPVNIGRVASETAPGSFRGEVNEIRIWTKGRYAGEIDHTHERPLGRSVSREGLAHYWPLDEPTGTAVPDQVGQKGGTLKGPNVEERLDELWVPSQFSARWTFYLDGEEISEANTEFVDVSEVGGHGSDGFTIGEQFRGHIDEVRIWDGGRTAEQVRDNRFARLFGDEPGLAGYWPLNETTDGQVRGRAKNRVPGTLRGPTPVPSDAPLGSEGPQVRNAFGDQSKPTHATGLTSVPAVGEYGDLQRDFEDLLVGVMKRCYVYADNEGMNLVTGFKVGDLELLYLGQVQTAPTLIGYIEGAPPVPSENLTVNDPVTDDYVGASSIQLVEAQETTQVYAASRDTGFDMSVGVKLGLSLEMEYGVFDTVVADSETRIGLQTKFDHSQSFLSGATVSDATHRTFTNELVLGGSWEEKQRHDGPQAPARYLNETVGQRYLPNNMGYALVKSGTADLFAQRLKKTGSLVAYQLVPNLDIPEDWNIIMFPLNPKYTKNGTLDGWVGHGQDDDYADLRPGEFGSYFKPLQAYALKKRIERAAKTIAGRYRNFQAGVKGRRSTTGEDGLMAELPGQGTLSYDWVENKARRSLVNTYVWTADGGFYAEEEQFSSLREESKGGSYAFLGQAGLYFSYEHTAIVGKHFELDTMFGGHINVTVTKSEQERSAFGLTVDVGGEGFLNRHDPETGAYLAEPCPGKVDAYRFMTFYLAPESGHFDEFFDRVVDQDWLYGRGAYEGRYLPNARALRAAMARKNEVWRVMHRVTFVSRIPPELETEPSVPASEAIAVQKPDNAYSNIRVIREVERRLPARTPERALTMATLNRAVERWIDQVEPASAGGVAPASADGKSRPRSPRMEQLRGDTLQYLQGYFELDASAASQPPELEPIPDRTVPEGRRLVVPLAAEVPDGAGVTLAADGLPEFGELADHGDGSGSLNFAPGYDAADRYRITVTATAAGGASSEQTFTLTVLDVIPPLETTIEEIPSGGLAQGTGQIELQLDRLSAGLSAQVQIRQGGEWQDVTTPDGGKAWYQEQVGSKRVAFTFGEGALNGQYRWVLYARRGERPRAIGASDGFRLTDTGRIVRARVTLGNRAP